MVVVTEDTSIEQEAQLIRMASAVGAARDGTVHVTRFDEVPDQIPLEAATGRQTPGDRSFEERMADHVASASVPLEYEEVVSHDRRHAIVNHAASLDVSAIVIEHETGAVHLPLLGSEMDWIRRHAPCEVIEVTDRVIGDIEKVTILSHRGPYDPEKLLVGNAIADAAGATVELRIAIDPEAPDQRRDAIVTHLEELTRNFTVPVTLGLIETGERPGSIVDVASGADLVVLSGDPGGLKGRVLGRPSDRVVEAIDSPAVVIYAGASRPARLRRLIENRLF